MKLPPPFVRFLTIGIVVTLVLYFGIAFFQKRPENMQQKPGVSQNAAFDGSRGRSEILEAFRGRQASLLAKEQELQAEQTYLQENHRLQANPITPLSEEEVLKEKERINRLIIETRSSRAQIAVFTELMAVRWMFWILPLVLILGAVYPTTLLFRLPALQRRFRADRSGQADNGSQGSNDVRKQKAVENPDEAGETQSIINPEELAVAISKQVTDTKFLDLLASKIAGSVEAPQFLELLASKIAGTIASSIAEHLTTAPGFLELLATKVAALLSSTQALQPGISPQSADIGNDKPVAQDTHSATVDNKPDGKATKPAEILVPVKQSVSSSDVITEAIQQLEGRKNLSAGLRTCLEDLKYLQLQREQMTTLLIPAKPAERQSYLKQNWSEFYRLFNVMPETVSDRWGMEEMVSEALRTAFSKLWNMTRQQLEGVGLKAIPAEVGRDKFEGASGKWIAKAWEETTDPSKADVIKEIVDQGIQLVDGQNARVLHEARVVVWHYDPASPSATVPEKSDELSSLDHKGLLSGGAGDKGNPLGELPGSHSEQDRGAARGTTNIHSESSASVNHEPTKLTVRIPFDTAVPMSKLSRQLPVLASGPSSNSSEDLRVIADWGQRIHDINKEITTYSNQGQPDDFAQFCQKHAQTWTKSLFRSMTSLEASAANLKGAEIRTGREIMNAAETVCEIMKTWLEERGIETIAPEIGQKLRPGGEIDLETVDTKFTSDISLHNTVAEVLEVGLRLQADFGVIKLCGPRIVVFSDNPSKKN